MAHRDLLTDAEMADEIGAPVPLVKWARAKDVSVMPPALDPAYDLPMQQAVIANTQRLYSHWGILDGTCPM